MSLTQLRCNNVYVKAIAGWLTQAKKKLQIKFRLIFWCRQSQNSLRTTGKIDSNLCADYHIKGPETGPWEVVCEALGLILGLFGLAY